MKAKFHQSIFFLLSIIVLISLVSCNLPGATGGIEVPTAPVEGEPAATQEVIATPELPAATALPIRSALSAAAPPQAGTVMKWVDFSDLIFVPGGAFNMGADGPVEKTYNPAHAVTLDGFWIHQAEVTNQQYKLCVESGGCTVPYEDEDVSYFYSEPSFANAPVTNVDWEQAQSYCTWIRGRLPTEAEWELTARGTDSLTYPWGDANPSCDLLNYDECLDPAAPAKVRSYPNGASPYDALDMSGNVFEWVNDWYGEGYYAQSPANNPLGPEEGEFRVYRGGSYLTSPDLITPVERFSARPEEHNVDLGFRCVLGGDVKVPPPTCSTLPLVPVPEGDVPDLPDTSVQPYCTIITGSPQTSIDVVIGVDSTTIDYLVTANGNPLTCNPYLSDPTRVGCYGGGLAQGASVEIGVCRVIEPSGPIIPTCPTGYTYNPTTTFCETGSGYPGPGEPCPPDYLEIPGVACFPPPTSGACPEGFYKVVFGATQACIPLDPCAYSLTRGLAEDCGTDCLQGMTYNAEQQCCQSPGILQVCPIGYETIDIDGQNYCIPSFLVQKPCDTFTVHVPACPTPTPSPVPSCSDYTTRESCPVNMCRWVYDANKVGRCVKP